MSDSERRLAAAKAFYGPLEAAASGARRVGWESEALHEVRLRALAGAVGPLEGWSSVLEVGAGEGALLGILRSEGFQGSYVGEEVREAAVDRARMRWREDARARFDVADSLAGGSGHRAEVVLSSGMLNTASGAEDHDAEVAAALAALWERTEDVLALDLAVLDRHPPGVGLARADLLRAWQAARRLAAVVEVSEGVVAGEALLVLARSRGPALKRRGIDPIAQAEALLAGGEGARAVAVLEGIGEPRGAAWRLVYGQALVAMGALERGLRELTAVRGGGALEEKAKLEMAPLLWRLGRRGEAEALLQALAETQDEARAHLVALWRARGDLTAARAMAATIQDAWIRREVLATCEEV